VLCEDGDGVQYVRGLTRDGQVFDIARNTLRLADGSTSDSEFAGACFSPNGRMLFVNIQGATSGGNSGAHGGGRNPSYLGAVE
jgi:hypothetical protein